MSQYFKDVAKIASSHHEKWDGSGYFLGLKGDEIPLGGRILAVSDVFDAITSRRHYRSKMDIAQALNILKEGMGKHFDPKIVDVFMSIESYKILEIINSAPVDEADKTILSKYQMKNIYMLYKDKENKEHTTEEERVIKTFDKYYNKN